ncbi:MAG TPA: hypothetical protein VFQ14_04000 [Thermoleophilaceae bacterium]|nr:hypothetical protein [Thermoleophilaceae bacterium]
MNRAEAEQERDRLTREHPDRSTHRWMARADEAGDWSVVKVGLPPGSHIDPLKATTEAKPKPPQPEDPRSAIGRNLPYHGI